MALTKEFSLVPTEVYDRNRIQERILTGSITFLKSRNLLLHLGILAEIFNNYSFESGQIIGPD